MPGILGAQESPLQVGIFEAVIKAETMSLRFERFCADIVGAHEGTPVISTSLNYDRGRDGRSVGSHAGIIIAASLRDNVEDKVREDIERLIATRTHIRVLYFCSSRALTEDRVDKIKEVISGFLKAAQIEVLGANHLAELVGKHPAAMETHYRAELADIRRSLLEPAMLDEPAEQLAMRLALSVHGNLNSIELRGGLLDNYVVTALAAAPGNIGDLARDVSNALRLQRPLPIPVVEDALARLREEGAAENIDGRWTLTPKGTQRQEESSSAAAENILAGRAIIAAAIRQATGVELTVDHIDRIWAVIQAGLAHLFYVRGMELVEFVGGLLRDPHDGPAPEALPARRNEKSSYSLMKELAKAVGATSSLPDQQAELEAATLELFSDPRSEAFKWLAQVCAGFVSLCALGLEHTSGEQVRAFVRRTTLVLDTDVVISLLCESEPGHPLTIDVVKRWQSLGQVLVADPVLYEVAYHAWIAHDEFTSVRALIRPDTERKGLRLFNNAFVRYFAELVADRKTSGNKWRDFIEQYQGSSETDISNVADICLRDFGLDRLPPFTTEHMEFARTVENWIYDHAHSAKDEGTRGKKIVRDKAQRDGALLAGVVAARRAARQARANKNYSVLSSSSRLRDAEIHFATDVGRPAVVFSTAAAIYILGLVPGMSLTMHAMQNLLFDERLHTHLGPVAQHALRIIAESEQFDIPAGRKATFLRRIDDQLRTTAESSRRPVPEVRAEFVDGGNPEAAAKIVASVLDSMATDSKLENELRAAREEIERLKRKGRQ